MEKTPSLIIIGLLEGIVDIKKSLDIPIYYLQKDFNREVDESIDTPFYDIVNALKNRDTAYESLQEFSINYVFELELYNPSLDISKAFRLIVDLGLEILKQLDSLNVYKDGKLNYDLIKLNYTSIYLLKERKDESPISL